MILASAPMAALTHAGLRLLIHQFADPDEYFTEMIHCPSLVCKGQFEDWYLHTAPAPEKLVWQLTSNDAEYAAKAVPIVLEKGGIGVDLNMGCCAPQIVQSGAGFAWMQKPLTETAHFVRTVRQAINEYEKTQGRAFRLSVKLRLEITENTAFLHSFVQMLIDEGVELITLHPRTQKQKYSRPAKHEFTHRLAEEFPIPIYGNGDINSFQKLQRMQSSYPCAGWMIGRAMIQKPWIFAELRGEQFEKPIDLYQTALLFLEFLQQEQPKEFWKTRMQRFFALYCDNFTFAHYCKTLLLNAEDIPEVEKRLQHYFAEVPEDRFLRG
ncbi:tRNA-dihydrouridine synthase family protein [Treponema phagedenis]|uniref:tRNA-dihydrouridine synthase family protein n=1 Tax=Treponema phagedenis TaxID=162 RepID=UPI0001F63B7F|nr:tRNA-dihydrouridine synthase family protein [Treponema phagedenis]EFW38543.1 dihydrouridine synthase (Dus) [Treponema phagedenis F0421]TYT78232.1 tRNA-dihydrouridine synthase family protein [Treponema phagedenis]